MEIGEPALLLHEQEMSEYKEPIGGGKRDRTPCADGQHDWECNTTGCADCWVPPCEPNRQREQDSYDALHQGADGSPQKRKETYKSRIQEQLAASKDPVGLKFEQRVLDSINADDLVFYSYKAHCKRCHVQAEIDFVTRTSILECKNSPKGFDLEQMATRIIPIAQKCFPGKSIVCVTPAEALRKLEGKLRQWKRTLPDAIGALGV